MREAKKTALESVSARAGVEGEPDSITHPRAGVPTRRARQRQNTRRLSVSVTAAHLQMIDFIASKGDCCPNAAH
jgi:hypothetical protein